MGPTTQVEEVFCKETQVQSDSDGRNSYAKKPSEHTDEPRWARSGPTLSQPWAGLNKAWASLAEKDTLTGR